MRRIIIAAVFSAVLMASAGAQAPSGRTVIKSVTVGTPGGAALTCPDVNRRKVFPPLKYYGWTAASQLTTERTPVKPLAPRLPQPDGPAVTYGKVPSRNEFGISRGWYPSPDGTRLAVYRVDESAVGEFPLLDITTRTGSLKSIRYPMNGMPSERVSLCVCDTLGNVVSTLKITDFTDERYLAGVTWTPDGTSILVQVMDRSQHALNFNVYNAADGSFVRTLFSESDSAWVEPRGGVSFIKGTGFFIYGTDVRDGYRQLYLCDMQGGVRRLTGCSADVEYLTDDGKFVYYKSAENSPVETRVYRIRLDNLVRCGKPASLAKVKVGKPELLTPESGTHNVLFSPDGTRFIDRWSAVDVPSNVVLRSADGKLLQVLRESPDPMIPYAPVTVELGTVPSADPSFLNYYRLVKPADFDPAKKYPLIVYVYGGPHSQMVTDSWLANVRPWELLMAQKGYVLYIQDNRGTDNRGYAFARAINRRCGVEETADQVEGIRQLISEGWVDESRIGVVGWSYGGFMTLTLLTAHPELFKAGAAGGPVVDWKWYEVMYGERYMDTEETNPDGFSLTRLEDKAGRLKARLLICQGMEDGIVLPINSMSFMQACVENNIIPDYYPYPRSEHNVTGPWREQLYLKLTDFFERFL